MARLDYGLAVALLGILLLGAKPGHCGNSIFEVVLPQGSGIEIRIQPRTPNEGWKPCYIIVYRKQMGILYIRAGERKSFSFSCQDPENYFVMEIQKNIDCMSGPCQFGEVTLQPQIWMLPKLNKTFIWDVKAHKRIGLELQFSPPRLRQIGPGESCPNGVSHSISGQTDGTSVQIGTFCSNGTVSRIKMQEGVKMALHLPWFLDRSIPSFSIVNGSSIKRFCIIESVFEREGSATLMSANYPEGFPEDELMTWQFNIPAHLRSSVSFLNFSVSNCEKKEERVEYYIPGSATNPEVFTLQDRQPGNMAGSFNLSLQGCVQDAQSPGLLRLQFQVLVQHPQKENNKTYVVDLSKERDMSVTIEPQNNKQGRKFIAGCFVCVEPWACSNNVTLTSGSKHKLSFLCDDLTRLRVVAEKTISCPETRYCHRKSHSLQVPDDILQLPVLLSDFSWKLLVPKDSLSLALVPAQNLQQHTHERPCNTSFSYILSGNIPGQELYFGAFCPGGSIKQIKVKQNVSVTLRTYSPNFRQESGRQGLAVSFIPYFKEEGVFTVTPDMKNKVYLRTPNWDRGLPPLSSVSWNISVPRGQVACLTFLKERSGVVCQTGRAYMIIQEQRNHAEEVFSLDDDVLPRPRFHHHSFWVNISNCSPVITKQLNLHFSVALTPQTVDLTVIIITVVGGGAFLLFALGLIICCVKKKKRMTHKGPAVGVYNGNINTQMPMHPKKFPKGRKDNDSHVYAVIEDTMVYGHLLQDSNGSFHQPEVDTYRPFQGPTGDTPPSPPSIGSRVPTKKLTSEEPAPDLPLESDSEPYTFSHPSNGIAGHGNTDIPLLSAHKPEEPTK